MVCRGSYPSETVRSEFTRVVSVLPGRVGERFSASSIRIALCNFTCFFVVYWAMLSVCGLYTIDIGRMKINYWSSDNWHGKTEVLGEKHVSVPILLPYIAHRMPQNRTSYLGLVVLRSVSHTMGRSCKRNAEWNIWTCWIKECKSDRYSENYTLQSFIIYVLHQTLSGWQKIISAGHAACT